MRRATGGLESSLVCRFWREHAIGDGLGRVHRREVLGDHLRTEMRRDRDLAHDAVRGRPEQVRLTIDEDERRAGIDVVRAGASAASAASRARSAMALMRRAIVLGRCDKTRATRSASSGSRCARTWRRSELRLIPVCPEMAERLRPSASISSAGLDAESCRLRTVARSDARCRPSGPSSRERGLSSTYRQNS